MPAPPSAPAPTPGSKGGVTSRVGPGTLLASTIGVFLIFGAGYARTHEAAERLTRTSSRPHPVHTAEVQQVLDMARFTNAAPAPARAAEASGPRATGATFPVPNPPPVDRSGVAPPPSAAAPAPSTPAESGGADRAPDPGPSAPPLTFSPSTQATGSAPADPASAAPVSAASASAEAQTSTPPASVSPAPAPLHDGTFSGWGYCRHGEIQATIIVEHGRITSAEITQCLTRYTCDWIAKLPPQVISRQSAEVDFVSGATESADAFYFAVEDALKKAR